MGQNIAQAFCLEDLPVFSLIRDIVSHNGDYFLLAEDFETLCFAEHFHSFHVRQGNDRNVSVLKVYELCLFKPFDLQTTYGFDRDDQYVVPVHLLL